MSRASLAGALVATVLLMALPAAAAPLPPAEVRTIGAVFLSPVIVVPSGGQVTFTSMEFTFHHQPTADDNSWTGHLMPGLTWPDPTQATFTVVIDEPAGSIVTYHCDIYASMRGVIVVV